VRVEGVLNRSDPNDGGGITLRATSLEILAPSARVDEPLNLPLITAAGIAVLLALAAWGWDRRRTRGRGV
jgi:hypothetical protein